MSKMPGLLLVLFFCLHSWASPLERPGKSCHLIFSDQELSPEFSLKRSLASLAPHLVSGSIRFDEYEMLQAGSDLKKVKERMSFSLQETRSRMQAAHREGKHVLISNGSFDLVHIGHASFVTHFISEYMRYTGLRRDQLFVVILADDDDLIFVEKAYKWEKNGGTEAFRRPIQSNMNISGAVHSRLLDLSSLPADLVSLVPSPRTAGGLLTDSNLLAALGESLPKVDAIAAGIKSGAMDLREEDLKHLDDVLYIGKNMMETLLQGQSEVLLQEYEKSEDYEYAKTSRVWNTTAWHLILNLYYTHGAETRDRFVKILNTRDSAYLMRVALMNNLAGIDVRFLQGASVVSTSDLLAKYGPELLIRAKKRSQGL